MIAVNDFGRLDNGTKLASLSPLIERGFAAPRAESLGLSGSQCLKDFARLSLAENLAERHSLSARGGGKAAVLRYGPMKN